MFEILSDCNGNTQTKKTFKCLTSCGKQQYERLYNSTNFGGTFAPPFVYFEQTAECHCSRVSLEVSSSLARRLYVLLRMIEAQLLQHTLWHLLRVALSLACWFHRNSLQFDAFRVLIAIFSSLSNAVSCTTLVHTTLMHEISLSLFYRLSSYLSLTSGGEQSALNLVVFILW